MVSWDAITFEDEHGLHETETPLQVFSFVAPFAGRFGLSRPGHATIMVNCQKGDVIGRATRGEFVTLLTYPDTMPMPTPPAGPPTTAPTPPA